MKKQKFTYSRIRQSFYFASKGSIENSIKRHKISEEINAFLNDEADNNGEVIYYDETLVDEGTVHVTVVFKYPA